MPWGFPLPETVGFPQLLAIFLAGADLSVGFSDKSGTRFLSEDSEIGVYDNPESFQISLRGQLKSAACSWRLSPRMRAIQIFGIRANLRNSANFWVVPPLGWRRRSSKFSRIYVPRGRRFSLRNYWRTLSFIES